MEDLVEEEVAWILRENVYIKESTKAMCNWMYIFYLILIEEE